MVNSDKHALNYPVDFYLGCSAGHRIDPAWGIIYSDIQPSVLNILKRFPDSKVSAEDLWSETIVRLMDDDTTVPPMSNGRCHAVIIRYRGVVKLLNYCVTIARRLAIQNFRKKRPYPIVDEMWEILSNGIHSNEYAELKESASKVLNALCEAVQKLSPEQKFLIIMVYREGHKQKDAGKLIGLSDFTTNRRIKSAIKTLKSSIREIVSDPKDFNLILWKQIWEMAWPESSFKRSVLKQSDKGPEDG